MNVFVTDFVEKNRIVRHNLKENSIRTEKYENPQTNKPQLTEAFKNIS